MRETGKVRGIIALGKLFQSFVHSTGDWFFRASEVQLVARRVHRIAGPPYVKPTKIPNPDCELDSYLSGMVAFGKTEQAGATAAN